MAFTQAEAAGPFKDVPEDHWAKKEISFLSSKGTISGFQDGTFQPQSVVTRGQAAIMITRARNIQLENRPDPGFKDVTKSHRAYSAIAALVAEKIYPKGINFAPDKPLTREEMARLLAYSYQLEGQKNKVFSDVTKEHWAQPFISLLAENGITAGFSNGTFQPKGHVTRAQFAVFLSRCLDESFKINSGSKQAPIIMKDIVFGMTYQQVKSKETRKLHFEYENKLDLSYLEYNAEKYGFTNHLFYYFADNQLNTVLYNFNPTNSGFTENELKTFYGKLQAMAAREFGSAFVRDEKDNESFFEYTSLWTLEGYEVFLVATNRSGKNFINLSYHLPEYKSAGLQTNKNRLNQLLEKMENYRQ